MRGNDNGEKNVHTLANTLADSIRRDTIEKNLHEGDFFMTVDQVGEHYGVSRTIAREAVSQLRGLGILESRQRRGLLIGSPNPIQLMSRWLPFYGRRRDGGKVHELAQLRYTLELGAVDLAISNCSKEDCERLAELASEFEEIAAACGHGRRADVADLPFHGLILQMTGNQLIAGMHGVLSDYFHASEKTEQPSDVSKAIREHQMIVEAFRQRDCELARSVLRCHLEGTLNAALRRTNACKPVKQTPEVN